MLAIVHPQAYVDATVKLGRGTKVRQFASITRGTVMGEDCSVSPGAMLDGSVYGDRVIVSGGVRAGAGFKVGNDVFLGPNVVLCNDVWPAVSKDGYDDKALRSGKFAVIIEDGASIGANATVLPGVKIGKGAVVAAGAVVNQDVPDDCVFTHGGRLKVKPEDCNSKRMRFV